MNLKGIPGIRNLFLTPSAVSSTKTGDRDAQTGYGGGQQRKKRNPSREEIREAVKLLQSMESVVKSNLSVTIVLNEGIEEIQIQDKMGKLLKALKGEEILRLLEQGAPQKESRGKILDRTL